MDHKGGSTGFGGATPAFPSTIWSEILAAGDLGRPDHRARLENLLRTYLRPVYAYIRAAWHKSSEDAKDLTQAFFTRVLEKGYLSHVRAERGSFRGYLKQALKHFLLDAKEAEEVRRQVQGAFSLDALSDVLDKIGPAAPGEPPERAYDREWFYCLVDGAIEELESSLSREGKSLYFEVFRKYLIDPLGASSRVSSKEILGHEDGSGVVTYAEVALRMGLRETDVRNYLFACRRRLREILGKRIRDYVMTEEDIEPELRGLLEG